MPAGSASLHRTFTESALLTMGQLPQAEALELAGRGARQLAHDPDLAWPLMRRQRRLQEPSHVGPQHLRWARRVARHHEDERLDQPARLRPGRLEGTMKTVSVARMPSRTSTPNRARRAS